MTEETKVTKTIEDKKLIESILYLKQNKLLKESKSTIKFETVKEAEDEAKEDVMTTIKEKMNFLKQDISELQKAGYALHLEGIKLLEIPLKQKIWLSTCNKKDLENIFKLLEEVSIIVSPLKESHEKEVAEKERLEKLADQKEREKAKTKKEPTTHLPASSSTKPQPPKSAVSKPTQ